MRVAIIGAGVIGLYTAYHLLREGFEVDIYEARYKIGYSASTHNPGMLNVVQNPWGSFKTRLMLHGLKLHREYSQDIGYNIMDTRLVLVYRKISHRMLSPFIPLYMRRYGIKFERIDGDILRKKYYEVNPVFKGAFIIDGYGIVNPYELLDKLAGRVVELGGKIHFNRRIKRAEKEPVIDGVEYDYIVIAAGPYTADIARTIDPNPPRQRFGKGIMVISSLTIDYIISEFNLLLSRYTKGGGVIPYYRGRWTILGPDFSWIDTKEIYEVSREEAEEVFYKYVHLLRDVPEIIDYFCGVRIINYPHNRWIIRKIGRYIITYGIDSPGLTAAPAIGEYITKNFIKTG